MTPNFWIFCCNPRANCDIAVIMGRNPEVRSWRMHPNQNKVKKGDVGFIRFAHNQKNHMADRKEYGLYVYCEVVSDVFPHNESALADKDRLVPVCEVMGRTAARDWDGRGGGASGGSRPG